MAGDPPEGERSTGNGAETIARLEAELAELRRLLSGDSLAARLREALLQATTAAEIAAPTSHDQLLDLILETASAVIGAQAGALFLIDESTGELVCEAAAGGQAERVKGLRLPLGHGIAGGVALTAQPLAVSEARKDPRWAADVGDRVGYLPDSLVCVPLFHGDRITGVLELLDKKGSPSFSPGDVYLLGLFANQAAVAIEQSRTRREIAAIVAASLQESISPEARAAAQLTEELARFAEGLEQDSGFRRSRELAALVNEIAQLGDAELGTCVAFLRAFAQYVRVRRSLPVTS